jgi:hypothetical protein
LIPFIRLDIGGVGASLAPLIQQVRRWRNDYVVEPEKTGNDDAGLASKQAHLVQRGASDIVYKFGKLPSVYAY